MTSNLEIRDSTPDDIATIEALYPQGFPDEDLLPLVADLLADSSVTLSLIGAVQSSVIGHVIFTHCRVTEGGGNAALLGPLIVAPAWQRRGVDAAIVNAGLGRLRDLGVSQVFVLGDPAYYGRLGFRTESLVMPPYELPPEWAGAWQSLAVTETAQPLSGKLLLPPPWLRPELWAP